MYQAVLSFGGPDLLKEENPSGEGTIKELIDKFTELKKDLNPHNWDLILEWEGKVKRYKDEIYSFTVRNKEIRIQTHTESLSHNMIPKVSLPRYQAWGDLLKWNLQENVPGEYPYTAGIYPFKRTGEDPTRMFAGEGGREGFPHQRAAHGGVAVDAHRNADPAAAQGNAALGSAIGDDAGQLVAEVGIIDAVGGVRAKVGDLMPLLDEPFVKRRLHIERGMV